MDGGAERWWRIRLLAELEPVVGEEFVEAAHGMSWNLGEQVAQVNEGIDPVAPGALDQGEEHGGGAPAPPAAQVQPIASAQAQGADCPLGRIVIHRDIARLKEPRERRPVRQRIVDGLAQSALGQELTLELEQPLFQRLHERRRFFLAQGKPAGFGLGQLRKRQPGAVLKPAA